MLGRHWISLLFREPPDQHAGGGHVEQSAEPEAGQREAAVCDGHGHGSSSDGAVPRNGEERKPKRRRKKVGPLRRHERQPASKSCRKEFLASQYAAAPRTAAPSLHLSYSRSTSGRASIRSRSARRKSPSEP